MQKSIVVVNPAKASGQAYCGMVHIFLSYKVVALWTSRAYKEKYDRYSSPQYIHYEMCADDYSSFEELVKNLKRHTPLAFLVGDDVGFPLADKLQIHFFPDHCNDPSLHDVRIDKYKYCEYLRNKGIVTFDQQLAEKGYALNNKKYILKPTTGQGNDKVFVVDSQQQYDNILSMYPEVQFILQDYIEGDELCVELIAYKDYYACTTIMEYTDVYYTDGIRPWRESNDLICPDLDKSKLAYEYAKKVVKALGVNVGITWTQIRIQDGVPHLMECNFRSQGNAHIQAIINSTKTNYAEEVLRSYLKRDSRYYNGDNPMYTKYGDFKKLGINNKKERFIKNIDWTTVSELESVLAVWPNDFVIPGFVEKTTGFANALGMLIVQNNNREQFERDVKRINAWKRQIEE